MKYSLYRRTSPPEWRRKVLAVQAMAQQYATGKTDTAQTFDTSAFHTRQTEGKRFYYQLEPNSAASRLLSPNGHTVWAATYRATGKANLIQ